MTFKNTVSLFTEVAMAVLIVLAILMVSGLMFFAYTGG